MELKLKLSVEKIVIMKIIINSKLCFGDVKIGWNITALVSGIEN